MKENVIEKRVETRVSSIISDNSNYFSQWGSRNPMLVVTEEVDNQIAAKPKYASMKITPMPGSICTIETYNDGIVPTHERMERMNHIGRTVSDRNGASICGVGQIEALVAGRKSPLSVGILEFISVYDGKQSEFKCIANGKDCTLTVNNTGPSPADGPNRVMKRYMNMRFIPEDEYEKIKTIIAMKIYPYAKENPDFEYYFNGEKIEPFGVLYEGRRDSTLKRMRIKEYSISYHGKEYTYKVGMVDASRYVKPDGQRIDEKHADKYDILTDMSAKSSGVFVELGGSNVILGGAESWKFINNNYHSTKSGIRIWISIPSDGYLKDAIFTESPNKSSINICLNEVQDVDGTRIFEPMLKEIDNIITTWSRYRESIDIRGKLVKKEREEELLKNIKSNKTFIAKLKEATRELSEEELALLSTKKLKTVIQFE